MFLPHAFTVEEATALVPFLEDSFTRLQALAARAHVLQEKVERSAVALSSEEGAASIATGDERTALATRLHQELSEVERAMREDLMNLHRLGVLVKSLVPGTVDVWALRGGEWVHLCWQRGESAFLHWHAREEGFAGRQPIDDPDHFGRSLPC